MGRELGGLAGIQHLGDGLGELRSLELKGARGGRDGLRVVIGWNKGENDGEQSD